MYLNGALWGKRVLVIGGSGPGVGNAVVDGVSRAGASGIAIVGRDPARLGATVQAAREAGCPQVVSFPGDVRNRRATQTIVDGAVEALGGLDVLVTVAGGMGAFARWEPVDITTDDSWDTLLDLNVAYVFRYIRECLPHFLRNAGGGVIVSIGAIAGCTASPMAVAYGAAKAGLANMASTVTAEYARRGVRMNVLHLGLIDNEAGANGRAQGVDASVIPMGRPGMPSEVANFVVFLASPLASYVSGQSITIDGGVTCRAPLRVPNSDDSMAG